MHPPIICRLTDDTPYYNLHVNCTSYRCLFLSKSKNPVQTGIKVCPQGIPVWTGFTVYPIPPRRDQAQH